MAGLLAQAADRQNVGLLFERVVSADLSGDQLIARNELVLGWQATFGTHRHAAAVRPD